MTHRIAATLGLLVFLGCFPCLAVSTHAQENRERQRSPQATVRTFLTSITLARGKPQFIDDAVACLDLTGLPAEQKKTAGLLATQLEAVLRSLDVDTGLIPDELGEAVYVLPNRSGHRIGLRRADDGRWSFDRETVAQVPKLYAETQKHRQESNREAAALQVSPDHASPRATTRTLVEGLRQRDYKRILGCLDLSEIPTVAREEVGAQLANKLKQILLRYRLPVLQEIPDSNFSDPHVVLSQPEGVIELVRIASGPHKGEWLYSRHTIRSIDKLFVAFEDRPYLPEVLALGVTAHLPDPWSEPELWLRSHLPSWLRASLLSTRRITLEVYEVLGYVLVAALAVVVNRLTTWLLALCLQWFLARRDWTLPRETMLKRLRPAGRFAAVLWLHWALLVLEPDTPLLVVFLAVLNPLLWVVGTWALFRLLDLITDLLEAHLAAQRGRPEITQMFWPVASLVLKICLFVYALFHLMGLFAWDATAVLTGLGIGGLAFALGAQDSLKNLFGSFTLIADRPFVVGESVKIGNHEVGVVEVVGLRSTRIRTADDTLLIVPNSSLTTMEITNYGRRRYRRYQTRIGLACSTSPEQLSAFRERLQKLIGQQEHTRKENMEVAVYELGSSAIEVLVNVYFEVASRRGHPPPGGGAARRTGLPDANDPPGKCGRAGRASGKVKEGTSGVHLLAGEGRPDRYQWLGAKRGAIWIRRIADHQERGKCHEAHEQAGGDEAGSDCGGWRRDWRPGGLRCRGRRGTCEKTEGEPRAASRKHRQGGELRGPGIVRGCRCEREPHSRAACRRGEETGPGLLRGRLRPVRPPRRLCGDDGGGGNAGIPVAAIANVMGRASNPRGVFVFISTLTGLPLAAPFHLVVICPEGFA
jgi:MscS family membrane protein